MSKDEKDRPGGPRAPAAERPSPKARRLRPWVIAIGAAFAAGFATPVVGAWALGMLAFPADHKASEVAGQAVVAVPEILTNLAPGSTARLIRTSVSLVVPAQAEASVRENLDRIHESFLEYCRQVDDADLRGSIGLYRMRGDLLRRARLLAGDAAVSEVLVQDLVLQ